jgi:hypothetical protein
MASLTAHLRRPDDHARLAFHPECPLCRAERLSDALPADALLGRRSQALLAASVLALSSAAPTAALATEPDEEQEGTAVPQIAPQDAWADPSSDVGGESIELPSIETPAPADEVSLELGDDPAEVALEPPIDDAAPVDAPDLAAEQEQQPPPPEPPTAPPAGQTPAPVAPQSAPDPVTAAEQPESDTGSRPRPRDRDKDRERTRPRNAATAPPSSTPAAHAPSPTSYEEAAATSHGETVTVTQTVPAAGESVASHATRAGHRIHVVRPGESLWSIARDLLGPDATSPARIAREVNRLWELNSARIGTGDPDLLLVGTRLVLR